MTRRAILLANLGGPNDLEAVEPFLYNLFSDKAILSLSQPFRYFLARFISRRRAPVAKEIYRQMGGGSPILKETKAQAHALEEALLKRRQKSGEEGKDKCFILMRYSSPRANEIISEIKAFKPDHIVLLPLYPQFSTTTTASSWEEWKKIAKREKLNLPQSLICCYPDHPNFIAAHASGLLKGLRQAKQEKAPLRILFSAHGLPERIIQKGDPYAHQVRRSAEAIIQQVKKHTESKNNKKSQQTVSKGLAIKDLDWRVSYQSRVGRLKWIEPYTEEEIKQAGKEGKGLILLPIAFVSEHSETLVELDIEYRELAEAHGVPYYIRIPALGTNTDYIDALADLVERSSPEKHILCVGGSPACLGEFEACPLQCEK